MEAISEYKPAICGICAYGCAVLVATKDGKIVDVKADSKAKYGHLCPRGKCATQIVHSDKRIKTPLIRIGPKGEAAFRQATWDEAIEFVTGKLLECKEKYGARSLASYLGGSSLEDSIREFGDKFFQHIRSPNDMSSGSICFVSSRIMAPVTTLGMVGRRIVADIDNSDVIFVWGTNPFTDSGKGRLGEIKQAQSRGAKVVVIDPRRCEISGMADLWISVLPGTDGALFLAMLKSLIDSGDYDQEFATEYAQGFPELKNYLSTMNTTELLELCGVSPEDFEKLMALFNSTQAASVVFYTGLEYQPSAVQCVRALYTLWALGGKLDVAGGLLLEGAPFETVKEHCFTGGDLPVGAAEYPLFAALTGKGQFIEFPKAVLENKPYAVKALLLVAGSPILSYPDPALWVRVFEALELLVVVDRYMSEECRYADVVLPATTYFENCSHELHKDGSIRLRQPVIPPVGEARNDVYILQSIAAGLGFGQALPENDEELIDRAFAHDTAKVQVLRSETYGIPGPPRSSHFKKYASGKLRKDGKPGFPTVSGKFEIASLLLQKYGYDPLPVYIHPYTEEDSDYPYYLTTGARSLYRYDSFGPNIADIDAQDKQATLDISPEDAAELGLKEGDKARIKTKSGELVLPVRFYAMHPRTVHVPVGGGSIFHSPGWRYSNANVLCDINAMDRVSGFAVCKAVPCQIEKI
jgi:anaerobic selenocysteine-containing dehydrogenase